MFLVKRPSITDGRCNLVFTMVNLTSMFSDPFWHQHSYVPSVSEPRYSRLNSTSSIFYRWWNECLLCVVFDECHGHRGIDSLPPRNASAVLEAFRLVVLSSAWPDSPWTAHLERMQSSWASTVIRDEDRQDEGVDSWSPIDLDDLVQDTVTDCVNTLAVDGIHFR